MMQFERGSYVYRKVGPKSLTIYWRPLWPRAANYVKTQYTLRKGRKYYYILVDVCRNSWYGSGREPTVKLRIDPATYDKLSRALAKAQPKDLPRIAREFEKVEKEAVS